jgi:hypothetical protein
MAYHFRIERSSVVGGGPPTILYDCIPIFAKIIPKKLHVGASNTMENISLHLFSFIFTSCLEK